MKSKNFILLTVAVAIVCLGLWWFMRPTVAVPENVAQAPMPTKTDTAAKYVAPPTIAPPVAPPMPSPRPASVAATPPLAANADPQADLKTAIPNMVQLFRDGDLVDYFQNNTPPDKLDPETVQILQSQQAELASQNANVQERVKEKNETEAATWESLESQTPTYNDTGDEATYSPSVVFIKINGKWYLKGLGN